MPIHYVFLDRHCKMQGCWREVLNIIVYFIYIYIRNSVLGGDRAIEVIMIIKVYLRDV